ncbi:UDP-glucose dehydrogenase family protein [Micromonospora sp. IBSANI012]|uniref:UDP-glucose dehydrogenase family protein n=1 Tax=Micromonospora sp. IBSANI012 TaxID=3457761 RepID=UPI0040586E1E
MDTGFTEAVDATAPKLTVIGTGYLGATHAVCMAVLGYQVLGVDIDPHKIERLAAGDMPFFEPGLPELLVKALDSGRLTFTTSLDEAADFGDVHFLCVGTPQLAGSYAADLRHVEAAVTTLARSVRRRALIVGKSTVPVGTAARLADLMRAVSPAGDSVELAWNPEFLREGFAVDDTMRPDRLVFGVSSRWAEQRLREVFAPVIDQGSPVLVTDPRTAELVKVAANGFLATKISYINAMAEVCEASGADVHDLAAALGLDDRIGRRFLRPGLGFGGGCLPKDIRAFMHRAEELGVGQAVTFLREVDGINQRRRGRMVDLVRELAGGDLRGVRVAALGAAFKPNSDDIRDSPALDVASALHQAGARVRVFDPVAIDNARRACPALEYGDSAFDVATGADVVVLLTEWTQFREIDPAALRTVVAKPRIVDGRHALDPARWREAGWEYRALGRP